jgi:transposase
MPRLRQDLRNQIIGLLQAGISQRECARRFSVHQSTISSLQRRFLNTGNVADRPRPGQKSVVTQRQDIYIRQRHLRDLSHQQFPLQI